MAKGTKTQAEVVRKMLRSRKPQRRLATMVKYAAAKIAKTTKPPFSNRLMTISSVVITDLLLCVERLRR
jgi:hypothetical protein